VTVITNICNAMLVIILLDFLGQWALNIENVTLLVYKVTHSFLVLFTCLIRNDGLILSYRCACSLIINFEQTETSYGHHATDIAPTFMLFNFLSSLISVWWLWFGDGN